MKTFQCAVVFASALLTSVPALAAGICPAYGYATGGCNEVITINANGSTTVTAGVGTTYDGSDDALVGIVNNTSSTLSSISLNGNGIGIFGFDGDGIDTFNAPGNSMDTTGYGGPDSYFTNISADQTMGTVDFVTALAANGGSTYFSLEEAFDPSNPPMPMPGPTSVTPEPGSLLLLGSGALAMAGAVRRRVLQ